MANETNDTPASAMASAMVGMVFQQPWQGYVPGERAGFSADACRKLYDAGVARYLDKKLNIMNLGADVMHKLRDFVLGSDETGMPVQMQEPQGFRQVPGHELLTQEPHASPSGRAGAPPPSVTPHESAAPVVQADGGTQWPAPAVGDAPPGESARPDELLGKKKK